MFLRRLLGVLVEDVRSGAEGRGVKRVDALLICLKVLSGDLLRQMDV